MRKTLRSILFCAFAAASISAQTTAFTFQGSLQTNGTPATGNYDFEFALFDAVSGGTQFGTTVPSNNVSVANGVFSVSLDFGGQFPGATRFLEIRVRAAGGGGFTLLSPRQRVASSPYSVKSLTADSATNAVNATIAATATNSLQLGGVAASQYVITTDPRMTDARNPLPNSANYIWNQNSVLQPSSNFIISGNGFVGGSLEANVVNATTHYHIGGNRILSNPGTNNLFTGVGAGANTTGNGNAFFGANAGQANTTGQLNAFFGANAGQANTGGFKNAIFGANAGDSNTDGFNNAFFGANAGDSNTTGDHNAFFGFQAGLLNIDGNFNAFFGSNAGNSNTGNDNAFFGANAGSSNTMGENNAFFGRSAGASNGSGLANSFFGSRAGSENMVGTSNSFFGSEAGSASLGNQNAFFGYRAGFANTIGDRNAFFGSNAGDTNTTGTYNTAIGYSADVQSNGLRNATAVGYRAAVGADHSLILGAIGGINGCGDFGSSCESVNVGIGTTTPVTRLHIVGGTDAATAGGGYIVTGDVGAVNLVIDNNEIIARNNGSVSTLFLNADGGDVNLIQNGSGNVGIGIATTPQDRLHVDGVIRVQTLGSAGTTSVCRNASNQLSTCSSSLRYKTKVQTFFGGLDVIRRLRPITFDWNDSGMHDMGLGAEDVTEVEPLLTTTNAKGEIEGVKYDRIGVVLVNAVKEQQVQIEALEKRNRSQQATLERQQIRIESLMRMICKLDPNKDEDICKQP